MLNGLFWRTVPLETSENLPWAVCSALCECVIIGILYCNSCVSRCFASYQLLLITVNRIALTFQVPFAVEPPFRVLESLPPEVIQGNIGPKMQHVIWRKQVWNLIKRELGCSLRPFHLLCGLGQVFNQSVLQFPYSG